MSYPVPIDVPLFPAFVPSAPILPKLYWDTMSQEQRIHRVCLDMHKLCEYANMLGENINLDHATIRALEDEFERFKESGFADYYIDILNAYVEEHFAELVRKHMGVIWPAIDDAGHFVLYSATVMELSFDTIMTPGEDFGRIVIRY